LSDFVGYFVHVRYQELYKVLLEKSEELQATLAEQKEDSKNAFIQAKQDFEDKGSKPYMRRL